MIKLTHINCSKEDAETLVIIPGGPGLSSLTLRTMDKLSENFKLIYVDFPGTNLNPYLKKYTFKQLCSELKKKISKFNPEHIIGHSYGGYFAIEMANLINLKSLTCLSTPLTEESLNNVNSNYYEKMTPTLQIAEDRWNKSQDKNSFVSWLSEYGKLYFFNDYGRNLILEDPASYQLFLDNRDEDLNLKSSTGTTGSSIFPFTV